MLTVRKYFAYLGLILCFFSGILPMLKVPIKGNWNLYQTDASLFFITYFLFGITALILFIRNIKIFRVMTLVLFCWYVISVVAVYFKINNYFGWGFADKLLAKTLHMRWGWLVYGLGVVLLLFSHKKLKNNA